MLTALLLACTVFTVAATATGVAAAQVSAQVSAVDPAGPVPARAEVTTEPLMRLQGSAVHLILELPGFEVDMARFEALRRLHGEKLASAGTLTAQDAQVIVFALRYGEGEPDSAWWRRHLLEAALAGSAQYDVGGVACAEIVRPLKPPFRDLVHHAFLVAGPLCAQLQIGELAEGERAPLGRQAFEAIVRSARLIVLHRGTPELLSPRVLLRMNELLRSGAEGRAEAAHVLAGALEVEDAAVIDRTSPQDRWTATDVADEAFAQAEVERALGCPPARGLELYATAERLLGALSEPSVAQRWQRALCHDARAQALVSLERLPEASAAAAAACVLAEQARAGEMPGAAVVAVLGELHYDLARARVRAGEEGAREALLRALEHAPDLRERARSERAFEALRQDPEVERALRG